MASGRIIALPLLLPALAIAADGRTLSGETFAIESVNAYEERLGGGCSLGCAIGWRYQASSTLQGQGNNSYAASNLGDARLASAWVEGREGHGEGEAITITFAGLPGDERSYPFRGIELVNGYAKNEPVWRANARVKRLAITLNDVPLFELALADSMLPQRFNFDDIPVKPDDRLTLTIIEVYPGERWADTALSEINLYGAH